MKRWNTLEYLDSEVEIVAFLEASLAEIEENAMDIRVFSRCLTKAAQARLINRIAENTEIDRQALCDLLLDTASDESNSAATEILKDNIGPILKVATALA